MNQTFILNLKSFVAEGSLTTSFLCVDTGQPTSSGFIKVVIYVFLNYL